jgi:hypothetical protein
MTVPWETARGGVLHPVERGWLKDAAAYVAQCYERPTIVNIGVLWYASMYCLRAGAPEAYLVGVDIRKDPCEVHPELKAKFIWGDSRVVHTTFKSSIHLLFIDGDHDYSVIKEDIANWTPKVVPEGIVAFHDYAPSKKHLIKHKLEGVRRAIDEWAATSGWKRIPAPGSLVAFQRLE